MTHTFYSRLENIANEHPENIAICMKDDSHYEEISYADLYDFVSRIDLGIEPGDRVAIITSNPERYLQSMLAVDHNNGISVPISPLHQEKTIKHMVDDLDPKKAILDPDIATFLTDYRPIKYDTEFIITEFDLRKSKDIIREKPYIFRKKDELLKKIGRQPKILRVEYFKDTVNGSNGNHYQRDKDETATVIHTSGLNSYPEAIEHTFASMNFSISNLERLLRLTEDDSVLCKTPKESMLGLSAIISALGNGATMLCPANSYDVLDIMEDKDPSVILANFYILDNLARDMDSADYFKRRYRKLKTLVGRAPPKKQLRLVVNSDAKLPQGAYDFFRKHRINMANVYNRAEGITNFSVNDINSIGSPAEGVEQKLTDTFTDYSDTEIGELAVNTGDGYNNTGDLAYIENGKAFLLGRKDRLVRINGYAINPEELESRLLASPYINQALVVPKYTRTKIRRKKLFDGLVLRVHPDTTHMLNINIGSVYRLLENEVKRAVADITKEHPIYPRIVNIDNTSKYVDIENIDAAPNHNVKFGNYFVHLTDNTINRRHLLKA